MDCPCEELLAGAARALDQHGAVALRHEREDLEQAGDGRTATDDVLEGIAGAELLAQLFDKRQVLKRLHPADCIAFGVFEQRGRDADGDPLALLVYDVRGGVDDRFAAGKGPAQGTVLLADIGSEDITALCPDGLIPADLRDPFGGGVETGDAPILIDGEDALIHGIENNTLVLRLLPFALHPSHLPFPMIAKRNEYKIS